MCNKPLHNVQLILLSSFVIHLTQSQRTGISIQRCVVYTYEEPAYKHFQILMTIFYTFLRGRLKVANSQLLEKAQGTFLVKIHEFLNSKEEIGRISFFKTILSVQYMEIISNGPVLGTRKTSILQKIFTGGFILFLPKV